MPKLKQLDCQVKWAGSNVPLKEYHVSYGDGFVRSYVAVPPIATPFYIQLKSNGFIAPGLAMFVYIDGEYHCNRNRCNLKSVNEAAAKHEIEVDIIVRQREKLIPGGQFVAKQWRFRPDHTGIIEVVVLRCYPGLASKTRKKAETVLSTPSTLTSIELSSDDDDALESAADRDPSHSDGLEGLGDLFDGNNDGPPATDLYLHFGVDGSWDARTQWDSTTAQNQGTLLPAPQNTSIRAPSQLSSPRWGMGNTSSQNQATQPSPAIIINVNQPPAQPIGAITPRSRVSSGSHSGQGNSQASSGIMMPGAQNIRTGNGQDDKEAWSGHSQGDASWATQGAQGNVSSEANNNSSGFDNQDQPENRGWDAGNSDPLDNNDDWENTDNQTHGDYDRNEEGNNYNQDENANWQNNRGQDDNAGWNNEKGQDSSAGWNNNEQNQGSDQRWGNGNHQAFQQYDAWTNGNEKHQANQGTQCDQGQSQKQVPTNSTNTGHTQPNQAELESPPQHFPIKFDAAQPHPAECPDPQPLPFTIDPNESHIKPYWAMWNHLPAESEPIFVEEDDISFDSDSNKSEGIRDAHIGVSSAYYTHKIGRPEYMDTHDSPYAVFAFSYRPTDVVERMLHVLARETEEEERVRLSVLSKDEILDHFMRAKSMPASGPPSQGSIWNAQTNVPADNSNVQPTSGLGIDLSGVNNKLSDFTVSGPGATGNLELGWQNNIKQQAGSDAHSDFQPWKSNGSGGHTVSPQRTEHWGGNANANAGSNATAGAQEPASGGGSGTGWSGSQGGGGSGKAPMMNGALAPQAGQQQMNHGQSSWQTQEINHGDGGSSGPNAPPGSPQAGGGATW